MRIVVAILAVVVLSTVAVLGGAALWYFSASSTGGGGPKFFQGSKGSTQTYEVELTDYRPPPPSAEDVLTDDSLDGKTPAFDPARADRRPLGPWRVNSSAAVVKLDVPLLKPDVDKGLLTLHPSYAAAVGPNAQAANVLPSVNLLDGKAKQFDDGLYAALDLAHYQGVKEQLLGHTQLVRRLYDRAGKDNVAAPFLAAGLELAGVHVEANDASRKQQLLSEFRGNEVASKPIGFYTWSEPLADCFRFLRYFQRPFAKNELEVPLALAQIIGGDKPLLADYQKAMAFYARLTNPYTTLVIADLVGRPALDPGGFVALCEEKRTFRKAVALFPASTSKETVLFEKLFPMGPPPNVNLMHELVRRIRSGDVDLRPRADSGWYEYQVYALETLLLPEKGEEKDKLQLTKAYKKRMLEAFQALMTKRRETHVRQMETTKSRPMAAPPPKLPDKVRPRLRVEPCPSYFLRTARAYAFLANFLEAAVGKELLQTLHGLKQTGPRTLDLYAELRSMRELFYGLYLVSAEDIGLKTTLAPEEGVEEERCYQAASAWLAKAFQDEDLKADTRVAVPIFVDANRNVTRLWLTLGVRLAKLEASYARPPHLKPAQGDGDWKAVEPTLLEGVSYLIPVDEFAEVELRGATVLSREELRAVCDREKTREAILQALQR